MSPNCSSCRNRQQDPQSFLHAESPALLMQADPRQVVTANAKACDLFGKELSQIEGARGGQVFDCLHSFTEAGCGKDTNCENCKIKNAVVDTFATGEPHEGIQTILDIKKHDAITPYDMQVSTEKIGDFVVLTVQNYKIKNPPPEGVVLSLPLQGDKFASCPQRRRGSLSPLYC
jgi:hypothetical protein